MRELSDVVADGNILRLVEKFLRAGVMEGGQLRPTRVGTPQGGVAVATASQHRLWMFSTGTFTNAASASCGTPTISWCSAAARTKPKRLWTLVEQLLANRSGSHLEPRKDEGDEVPRRVYLSGLRPQVAIREDACQVGGELQDESSPDYPTQPQPGRRNDRATQPRDPGHGELFRHALVALR